MKGADLVVFPTSFEDAIVNAGYGMFHIVLFLFIGATYAAIAMEVTLVSFVVPSAKCDFGMTSEDAGFLTAVPMLGMTFGSFFWGCLADVAGRKWVMVSSLLIGGATGLASSLSQSFVVFVTLRFFNGFALVGALSLCLPYLGEFQPNSQRKKVLCWMEFFWTLGIIGTPSLAWFIIPLNIGYKTPTFFFSSWNAFVAASASPVFIFGIVACYFPESPKFLMEIEEYGKAFKVFQFIYSKNTGEDRASYPLKNLIESGVCTITKPTEKKTRKRTFRSFVKNMGTIVTTLFSPIYRKRTFLICFISFGLSASYYTLMLWFPELFTRFQHFEELHPNTPTSVCQVASIFVDKESCHNDIPTNVYMNTFFVGLSCIPTSIWLPLCIDKLGAKFFMTFCVVVSGVVAFAMYFVTSALQNLILSCCFEALTSLGVVTMFCVLVDLFPTSVRVVASSLTICAGRIGALLGNLLFGYLIDLNCVVPIMLFAGTLLVCGLLCTLLPIRRGKEDLN